MNFISYCPSSRPHTLRIIDAHSGSVAAASGCSGAEAAWRDVNCVLTAPQTAQKQQQLLELIEAHGWVWMVESLTRQAALLPGQRKQDWNAIGESIWCMFWDKVWTVATRFVTAEDC